MRIWHEWYVLFAESPQKLLGLCAWILAAALIFGFCEWRWPLRQQKFWRENFWQDIGYNLIGGLVPAFIIVAATLGIAWFLSGLIPNKYLLWVNSQALWLKILVTLLVGEVCYYWAHRWSHEIPWLWRFHAIHHAPTQLDWLVNTRAHPIELAFTRIIPSIPILALGLRQGGSAHMELFIGAYRTVNTLWAYFIHSNVGWRFGWLEQVIVCPAFHHWHHANDNEQVLNKNYAAIFPWVDRLFGTYHLPAANHPMSYGSSTVLPTGLWQQLLFPFRKTSSSASSKAAPDPKPPQMSS